MKRSISLMLLAHLIFLQQTIDLNRCVPGVYKLKVAANQDLPFVLEDIRFFSVNTEITFKKSCLCVE